MADARVSKGKKKSNKRPNTDQTSNKNKNFKGKKQKFGKSDGKKFQKKTAGKKTPFPKKKSFGGQNTSGKGKGHDTKNNEDEEKPNIWQMKKKERKEYRKKHDEHYDLIHSIKQHYEKLRRKDIKEDKKVEIVDQILALIAGHTHEVIFKHDTGRVMQCCVKYGNKKQRKELFEQFKDDFEDMTKSKYSKFFIKKMLKYGTKEQRRFIIQCFNGQVRKLIKHQEASEILELVYTDYAVAAEKTSLMQEFYGPEFAVFKTLDNRSLEQILKDEPLKKPDITRHLKEALSSLVDKSVIKHNVVHRVLLEYFSLADHTEKLEMIESIRESVVLILHTHDGARVAMQCLWDGNTKDRKTILKSFKTYVTKICKEEYGHMVMLSLFDAVDDTVLVKKIIFPEIKANLKELAQDVYGRKVLFYLLMPRAPTHFHPDIIKVIQKGDDNPNSKKDPEIRRKELLSGISSNLLDLVKDHGEELMMDKGSCQVVMAILGKCTGDVVPAMNAVAEAASKDFDPSTSDDEDHLVKSASGHFALKRLVIQDKDRMESTNEQDKVYFSNILLDAVSPPNILEWCKVNRGAFVVTSLLESSVPGVAEKVKKIVSPKLKKLEKHHPSKGLEIISKIIHQ